MFSLSIILFVLYHSAFLFRYAYLQRLMTLPNVKSTKKPSGTLQISIENANVILYISETFCPSTLQRPIIKSLSTVQTDSHQISPSKIPSAFARHGSILKIDGWCPRYALRRISGPCGTANNAHGTRDRKKSKGGNDDDAVDGWTMLTHAVHPGIATRGINAWCAVCARAPGDRSWRLYRAMPCHRYTARARRIEPRRAAPRRFGRR